MPHPELLLVPVMLAVDYFLTLWGAAAAERIHARHFRYEQYELNPAWQRDIKQRRWFNPRAMLRIGLVSVACMYLAWIPAAPQFFEVLMGFFFGSHGAIIGRHVGNLMSFRYLDKHPHEIQGEVYLAYPTLMTFSQSNYLVAVVPLLLIGIMTGQPMVLGGIAGALFVFALHGFWRRKARKAAAKPVPTEPPGSPQDISPGFEQAGELRQS